MDQTALGQFFVTNLNLEGTHPIPRFETNWDDATGICANLLGKFHWIC